MNRILSLFDCPLRDVKRLLPIISRQGFNIVQVSPLQRVKDEGSNEWYLLYQPLGFEIGNRIGTKEELYDLCLEARKYGIHIVVDAVINHVANKSAEEFLDEKDRDINSFIRRALSDHANDPMVQTAIIADEYNHQRNRTVMNYAKWLYDMNGAKVQDTVSSTNRIASNFFRRLNVQRNTYLLGNGVSFADTATKKKLGSTFDSVKGYSVGYRACVEDVCRG